MIEPCLKTKCDSADAASATTYLQSQCADGGFTIQRTSPHMPLAAVRACYCFYGFPVRLVIVVRDVASASGSEASGSESSIPSGTRYFPLHSTIVAGRRDINDSDVNASSTVVQAASGTSESAADKIILSTGNSGAFLGLVGAIVFGLLAI